MSHPSGRPRPGHRLGGLPIHLEVSADLGARSLERGEVARGMREIDRALLEAPEHPELLRLRALGLMLQGEVAQALECYHEAAERWPEDALIACQLGAALAQSGDMPAAEDAFRRAIAQDPLLIDGWYNLGHALDARADTAGACAAFERVLQIRPDHVPARVQRGEMLKMLGRLDEAEREFRSVLSREPDSVSAWVGLSNLKTFQPNDAELEQLLRLRASGRVPEQRRVDLAFACASLLEQRGRYAEAFPLFVAANAGKRKLVRWNAAAVSALVDRILAQFTRLPEISHDGVRGSEAIFLVGMPRSGSTLVEQILSAHPDVQGGGERNEIVQVLQEESRRRGRMFPDWVGDATDSDWARLGMDVLHRCNSWRDGRPFFTNKTLTNWQTLGAIRRMLPDAHIVHCQRDPLETLWSCFKHHFGEAQFFTYDFDELIAFWRDCDRAMKTWTRAWPGWIHAFVHEDLLDDPESRIRDLLAFCGLGFDAACVSFQDNPRDVRTSSASQVRQPLRRDLAVARHYGDLLDSLRCSISDGEKLARADLASH
jgi:tetratricopeptide (TPR) repeat protein